MPRICSAVLRASSDVRASLMPPAFPRLPAGTCALTTQGPIFVAAVAASAAVLQSIPRSVGMPAAFRTSDLAACSSKFITHHPTWRQFARRQSASVFFPISAEQVFLTRLVFRNCRDEVRNVEEMLVVQVLRNAVAPPGTAPHA